MNNLEEMINNLTHSILSDYKDDRTINEIKTFDHPDNDEIISIIEGLRRIIFPG